MLKVTMVMMILLMMMTMKMMMLKMLMKLMKLTNHMMNADLSHSVIYQIVEQSDRYTF